MANNKSNNEKMDQIIKRINDEPKKANDTIIQIKSFIGKIEKDKTIDSGTFSSFKETINNYLSSNYISDEQKELLLKINNQLKLIKLLESDDIEDKSKDQYNQNKTKIGNTTDYSQNFKKVTNDTKNINKQNQESTNNEKIILDKLIEAIKETISQENLHIIKKLTTIESNIKTLDEDIDHKVKQINKDTKEVKNTIEVLETLPAKIDKLNSDVNDMDFGTAKKSVNEVPKDIQAIEELTKFMKDGLEQFENIASYYVLKQSEFENAEKKQNDLKNNIQEEKDRSFTEGKNAAKIDIVRNIYNMAPTIFDNVKSLFEDILFYKYTTNDQISVTSENKQHLEVEIEGILQESNTYIIQTPTIFVDNKVLVRATVIEVSK